MYNVHCFTVGCVLVGIYICFMFYNIFILLYGITVIHMCSILYNNVSFRGCRHSALENRLASIVKFYLKLLWCALYCTIIIL